MSVSDNKLDLIDFWAFTIAFAPKRAVLDAVQQQLSKWWKAGVDVCQDGSSLAPLQLPKEYNPDAMMVALFELESPSPAILIESNLTDGYRSLSHMLARSLSTETFAIVRSKPAGRDEWPIEEFGLLNESQGGYVRHVWAALDTSGWKFGNTGELRQWEDPDCYSKRRIRDRFTRRQVVQFLDELGVDLWSLAEPENYKLVRCFVQAGR